MRFHTKLLSTFSRPAHIAPLVVFRIAIGAILFVSIIRFMMMGWVHDLYVAPKIYFPYYGFEWVKPLSEPLMYLLFSALALSFLFQALGLFYKAASIFSFSAFTYIELIDKTNYLNHYYFVSIICFLLIFVPAHRYFSLDVLRKPHLRSTHVPNYYVLLFKLQLCIVYFYAGLAKLNYDWLVNAQPLKIWLPARADLPLIGPLLKQTWVAYIFSWFGALYDLTIPFLLLNSSSRKIAYFFVIVFHLMTYALFQIGMFPFIMIAASLIFFSENIHLRIIGKLKGFFKSANKQGTPQIFVPAIGRKIILTLLGFFFLWQLLMPMRYLLYPNKLFWTEEGYRFSWRVMLMEKAGYAIFHVEDPKNNRSWEVNNYDFLTPNQEKMMSTQADMILQFAHYLEGHYLEQGIEDPKIRAEVYVSLNGSPSQLYLDTAVDLTEIEEGFATKSWILPLEQRTND